MKRYTKFSATLMLLSATALAGVAVATAPALAAPKGPTVNTTEGPVKGFVKNGVNTFLGVPYAAPPVGNLRWMPPQPPENRNGVLHATEFGNTCPQVTELGAFAGPSSTTEDCLYLNIFTTSTKGSKPVLVWIHGGGNVDGETNDYDGSKLAKGGENGTPIVVVTINYRMGLFGFLSQDDLNAEGHPWGNYGILDQQAALQWVQDNIADFGGDLNNVTLGGQSAGSSDTSANLISQAAAGLFHRAINQSPPTSSFQSAATALQRGNDFAAAADCSDAACLRDLSAARILQLQGTPNANGPYITGPFVDGTIIPLQPEVAWSTGQYHHMPIAGGTTKDEFTFVGSIRVYFSGPPQVPLTPQEYVDGITAAYGADAPLVLAEYPLANYGGDTEEAYNRVNTDPFKCRSLHVLDLQRGSNEGHPVYGWDFTYEDAPYYFPQMPNPESPTGFFQALASHTIDIQFIFDKWHGGQLGVNLDQVTGQPRELEGPELGLSEQLIAAWTNFVATGDPNGPGVPTWPAFPTTGPVTFLKQDIPSSLESEADYRADYKCDFWDTILTYPTT